MHEHDHDRGMAPKKGAKASGGLGDAPVAKNESAGKESKIDKVKGALNMK